MKRALSLKKAAAEFEQAFDSIRLSTWNRQRSNGELHSFISRRELVVEDIDL